MTNSLRIAVHSDFHIDAASHQSDIRLTLPPCDVLVVAGDVCAPCYRMMKQGYHGALRWLRSQAGADLPIVFVLGNSEYSHFNYDQVVENLAQEAREQGIYFLHDSYVDLLGVRFLGSPLFSSVQLPQQCPDLLARYIDSKLVHFDMSRLDNDRCVCGSRPICASVNWRSGTRHGNEVVVDHDWYIQQYLKSRTFLTQQLDGPCPLPRVVVSHWAPSLASIDPSEIPLSEKHAYWASDNDDLVVRANVWIHGHVHKSVHYRLGSDPNRGLVLSNCLGHPQELFGNPLYCPQGLLDLSWDTPERVHTNWSGIDIHPPTRI